MLCKYPPMGWNSWDCYGAAVTEEQVLQNAQYMAEHLKPFGWEYIVVDIQWSSPTAINHEYQPFSEHSTAPVSEDSLYLNVWRPAEKGTGSGKPLPGISCSVCGSQQ